MTVLAIVTIIIIIIIIIIITSLSHAMKDSLKAITRKHTYHVSSPLLFLLLASCKCLLTAFVNEPALSFLKSAATAWKTK